MLCEACQDIFAIPRKISCGTYYPWKQDVASFQNALLAGCHLCNLVDENRSYNKYADDKFPNDTRYAFKPLNPNWARSGKGAKWLVPQTAREDEIAERARYWEDFETDPTPNKLGWHLANDSETLVDEMKNSWLVLEFYGSCTQVVLPMELVTDDEEDDLAQQNMDGQSSTGSQESLQIGKAWLHNCLTNHSLCKPLQPESWLPTRLLDVGSSNEPTVRLILSSSLNVETQYAALSHRWGTEMCCVLDSTNIAAFQEVIQLPQISATIRDSVAVTRALGLQYLWVDSMCIMQDDPEDWARESATMSKVYGLSTCTIAAATSGIGSNGFFAKRNQYRVRPCRVPSPFSKNSKHCFYIRSQYLHQIHARDVRGSLWYNRGWVFQERTLSPRLLLFSGTQILWACERLQAAETWPCGKTSENHIDRFESFAVEKARFLKLLNRTHGVPTDHSTWWTFLQDYMKSAELTRRSDRLAAIQGIATLIQGLTGENYCAGFWLTDDLATALLWKVCTILSRPKEYRAPSWSWAAVDGTVMLNTAGRGSTKTLMHILGHECFQFNQPRGGRNTQGEALRVSGKLLPVAILTSREGVSCDNLLTVEYSNTITLRTKVIFRMTWHRFLDRVTPISVFLWHHGVRHICIAAGVLLCIGLIPAFIALFIAMIPVASALIPALLLLWAAFWLLWKICWACWIGLRFIYSSCTIRRADERENMRRAQQRADATARREYILDGLERGIPLAELVQAKPLAKTQGKTPDSKTEVVAISANCSFDVLLPGTKIIQVICLPVVQKEVEISGLLLQLVDGTTDHYERVGVFSATGQQLQKLPYPSSSTTIVLV